MRLFKSLMLKLEGLLQYLDSMTVLGENTVMVAENATTYSIDELSDEVARLLQKRGLKNSQAGQSSFCCTRQTDYQVLHIARIVGPAYH